MVCCAADGICEEDKEGRARVGGPQRVGDSELEGDDKEDDPLCQRLVSHEFRNLKVAKMSGVSVTHDGERGFPLTSGCALRICMRRER
jgi:hypothetical protein